MMMCNVLLNGSTVKIVFSLHPLQTDLTIRFVRSVCNGWSENTILTVEVILLAHRKVSLVRIVNKTETLQMTQNI